MGKDTGISWTDHTFNPWWGCEKVSPGCAHCYAEAFSKRTGHNIWGAGRDRRMFGDKHWKEPRTWNASATSPEKVFCASMCDVFEQHPALKAPRLKLWDLIRDTPNLIWQLLTKRPENIKSMTPTDILQQANIWFGTSAEDQERWNTRVPVLLECGSRVAFVSAEPLLGPINPGPELFMLDWIIIGGESGGQRRPCNVDWIIDLANDADAGGVSVFVKQDGGLKPGQKGSIPIEIWLMKQFPQ